MDKVLIFCATKKGCEFLRKNLMNEGYTINTNFLVIIIINNLQGFECSVIHGDKS